MIPILLQYCYNLWATISLKRGQHLELPLVHFQNCPPTNPPSNPPTDPSKKNWLRRGLFDLSISLEKVHHLAEAIATGSENANNNASLGNYARTFKEFLEQTVTLVALSCTSVHLLRPINILNSTCCCECLEHYQTIIGTNLENKPRIYSSKKSAKYTSTSNFTLVAWKRNSPNAKPC